jgi:hypothetical protein
MSSGAKGKKQAATAKFMKERKVTRRTGSCPRGCGVPILNGGPALLSHLTTCQGKRGKRHAA